jgi:hypothetical protein
MPLSLPNISASPGRLFTSGPAALRAQNTTLKVWQTNLKLLTIKEQRGNSYSGGKNKTLKKEIYLLWQEEVLYEKEYSEEISTWKIEKELAKILGPVLPMWSASI